MGIFNISTYIRTYLKLFSMNFFLSIRKFNGIVTIEYIRNIEHFVTMAFDGTCNSCNTGTSALPDMYAQCPRVRSARGRVRTYRQRTSACVTTNMLHFRYSKICPNRLATVLTFYIGAHSCYDCGICI